MAFTDDEKTKILRYLGYPDWVSMSQSIQLGYPAAAQPMFLVVDAFNRMTPTAEGKIRFDLCQLDKIECQIGDAPSRMKARRIGDLEINPQEFNQLLGLLRFWTIRLADDFGVTVNPMSQMSWQGLGGGRNARVVG